MSFEVHFYTPQKDKKVYILCYNFLNSLFDSQLSIEICPSQLGAEVRPDDVVNLETSTNLFVIYIRLVGTPSGVPLMSPSANIVELLRTRSRLHNQVMNDLAHDQNHLTWIPWNLSFRHILFHEKKTHFPIWSGSAFYQIWLGRQPPKSYLVKCTSCWYQKMRFFMK